MSNTTTAFTALALVDRLAEQVQALTDDGTLCFFGGDTHSFALRALSKDLKEACNGQRQEHPVLDVDADWRG